MTGADFRHIYPIVDVVDRTASGPLALIDALLDAGVPWLQLRCKAPGAAHHLELARELARRAAPRAARLIVNDRIDIALLAGAAGVHLGQSDLPLAAARRLAAGRLAIGISTHSVAEAERAALGGADYIGFGPMFPTASKADALSPRSLDELRRVRAAVAIPIVAIGGITEGTAAAVLAAGADAVAMIGAFASSPDPGRLAARLMRR